MIDTGPEVVTVGETMALVAPAEAESVASAVDFLVDPGGAEANVASHLAALGHRAAWVGAVGDDALGRRICAQLAARGVDVSYVTFDPDAPTGLYVKDPGIGVVYYRTGSAASRMGPGLLRDLPPLDSVPVVHLSGITTALSPSCRALNEAVLDAAPTITYDVNHRPVLWQPGEAADVLRAEADRATIVFVGRDEAETLWGVASDTAIRNLLPHPDRIVIKDGPVGATEIGVDGIWHEPAPRIDVVEAIGAGDAFAGGYLAALLEGFTPAARLRRGHERAAVTLASTGDFPRGPVPDRPRETQRENTSGRNR